TADVGGHTLAVMEDLDGPISDPGPQRPLQKLVGHRVVMPLDLDMVIEADTALEPVGIRVGAGRKGAEGRTVELHKQVAPTGAKMAGYLTVQPGQQVADRRVQRGKREEPPLAQAGDDPALD